ncbi:MAG: hypothetical protein QM697_08525 [Lachnospiraceae bacterium]
MNPMALLQLQEAWNKFKSNHPKFPLFMDAVAKEGICENTVIEVNVTTAEGKSYSTNVKLTPSDMELIGLLKSIRN